MIRLALFFSFFFFFFFVGEFRPVRLKLCALACTSATQQSQCDIQRFSNRNSGSSAASEMQ